MQNTDPYQTPGTDNLTVANDEIGPIEPLTKSTGWLKLVGAMSIIGSLLTILSFIVTFFSARSHMPAATLIPIGLMTFLMIIPIWIGVLLFQAGTRLNIENGAASLFSGAEKLRLIFKITGIICLIYLVLIIVVILFSIISAMAASHF